MGINMVTADVKHVVTVKLKKKSTNEDKLKSLFKGSLFTKKNCNLYIWEQ